VLGLGTACRTGSTEPGGATPSWSGAAGTTTGGGQLGPGGSGGEGGEATSPALDSSFDGSSRFTGLPETSCAVSVTSAELSPHIATVGIVSFSSNLTGLSAAEIHFGPTTDYGLVAPVGLTEAGHRTLLLGMTENRTYHFRVAVSDGTFVCYGDDATLETGSLNSSPLAEASTSDDAAPGFIVTSRDGEAVIYNRQGELVWAYDMWNVFAVHLSWDGKYMIGRDAGPFDAGEGGSFYRVEMDGSNFTTLDAPGGDHHDFTAIPTGIAYLAKPGAGECDWVFEASDDITDGTPSFDTGRIYEHFPDEGEVEGTAICHANRLHYSLERDMYTVSDRNKDALAVFTSSGAPITSIGKAPTGSWTQHIQAEGAGPGGDWHVQHGHHYYADDQLVVFSNESNGGSAILHYTISEGTAALDWKYAGAGESRIAGDVQHLPNGNFLVTTNLAGTMVELGPDGRTEVGRYILGDPIGPLYGFGYSSHRPTLYGSPAPR
jgi:hypothetical protein